ncbi:N-acetyl-alpha-D-glucosaminyl L-malate synthase BshA [Elysia marginata]|uniref:N-acetyl-alpha-D-glucosaminyl L-malate synthase BshA n=1 Tax=Elysia marginata TaxID=1093978 RepID=A0AAV4FW96_9GAST|nr:N-acetyl-alpha-D-glucosaminyl L-malate synthase BshA [Elysia marginata]
MANQILKSERHYIPVVTTLHGTDITLLGSHPNYKPAVTFSINESDAVTTVSQSLKKDTLNRFDIHKDIHVIPNFINFEDLGNSKDCRNNLASENESIIVHISNFRKVKRIPDVIKVFHKIQKDIPSKLLMIGEGPEKDKAEQLASSLRINDNVLFLGNSNETGRVLQHADLFLLPSENESFGLVALEAMAHHTPVISTNVGGIPEVNIHKKTGFLFQIGDVQAMAQAAIELLRDRKKLYHYKQAAFNHSKGFDIAYILPNYISVYKSILTCK